MHQQQSPEKHVSTEDYLQQIEANLADFEQEEKARLNIQQQEKQHWRDANPNTFTAKQRAHTTILHAGLTMAHDIFIQSALRGLGYKAEAMDVPDTKSLQFGREFGNRGQCNPTYFTVGNLVKKLKQLEKDGMSKDDIIKNHVFVTGGSCGPCRFGTYVTEYRKALRDAGFEGFRVLLFQHADGVKQATGEEMGLKINAKLFYTLSQAVILGDVINALTYRIRPYEVEEGATDKAVVRAKERITQAFERNKGLLKALYQTRKDFASIKVDRTQVKPRVAIIGEFWAMTTEGDGNYQMQRFLEKEGAEVDIQLVSNWFLYLIWAAKYDTQERAKLKGVDKSKALHDNQGSKFSLENVDVAKRLMMLRIGRTFITMVFHIFAKLLGLKDYHLPDMEHIAQISHKFYNNNLRGGEGHMEVGKLIHNVVDQKVNMTLSIKPFGCMPSSAVSDGVQSLITELYPSAIFLPIETNGDGAVNVYSRVQMQLFKARQSAEKELQECLEQQSWSMDDFKQQVASIPALEAAHYRSLHAGACTAVDLIHDVIARQKNPFYRLGFWLKKRLPGAAKQKKQATIDAVEAAARRFQQRHHNERYADIAVQVVEP
ncbi:MAG: 2-hydroxyglutaryl-CoA dehydratase [Kangiellaceae bacterium]|nr:2-hydroxyglutaryl-CoA dehydratase [Kangiellaceae bacterium]